MASTVDGLNNLLTCGDFCRLCLEEEEEHYFWDIFQAIDNDGANLRLVEKIIACLDIMVEIDDGIPHKICGKCMTVVRSFFEFRKQCKLNDMTLRKFFITANNEKMQTERTAIRNSPLLSPRGINESPKQCDQAAFPCIEESNDSPSVMHRLRETQDVSKAVHIPSVKLLEDEWSDDDPSATNTVFEEELRLGETPDVSNAVQIPFLKQLEDEWSDDDHSAISTVLQEDTIMESPWRHEDLIAEGSDSSLIRSNGNVDPDKNKFPEKCTTDSSTKTVKQRKKREFSTSSNFKKGQVSTDKSFIRKSVLISPNDESRSEQACQIDHCNTSASNDGTSKLNGTAAVTEEILGGRASRSVDGKWVCSICNKNYTTLRALKKHILIHYSGQFICSECPASFENEEALGIHKAKHSTSSLVLGYSCQHCFKTYRRKYMLEQHITTEHVLPNDCVPGKFLEKCGKCAKNFSSSTEMEAHDDSCGDMSIHSEEDSSDTASIEPLTESKECFLCKLKFENMPQLTFHLKKFHNIVQSFKCEVCAKVFDTYPKLSDHRSKVHIVKHSCEYCKRTFREKSKLRRHLKLHDELYECNLCSKSFRTKDILASHQNTHTKPFQCAKCSKKFRNKYQLNLHINCVHLGIKDFMCDRCGEKFICKTRLKNHVSRAMRHQLECKICGEMFCIQQKFQRHVKSHDSTLVHPCKKCDAKFLSSQGLCSHMRLEHPP